MEKLHNHLGEALEFDYQPQPESPWLFLLAHGVTGNMDRPLIAETQTALQMAGLSTLRFSFAGNGNSEGRFTESCVSKELREVRAILDQLPSATKVGYLGHSMGAAVGVLAASQDDRIKALISLAGMVDCKAFAQTEFGEVTPDDGLMWDEPDCPLSRLFMEDLCETVGNVLPATRKIRVPWLLVHGTEDDVVLPRDTESVSAALGEKVKVVTIPEGDHLFNGPARQPALEAVVQFAKNL